VLIDMAGDDSGVEAALAIAYRRGMSAEPTDFAEDIAVIANRVAVVILQHPQEKKEALGTAALAAQSFKRATLKVGLSWPSLTNVLGRSVDPKRWAVLYLGSAKAGELAAGLEVVVVDRQGAVLADQRAALAGIEGVIVLDGSWSQAKALWWRNAWLLKCRRIVLGPRRPSRYGKLRREPRRDALSTIEAAAFLVSRLENRPEIETRLGVNFDQLLDRHRAASKSPSPAAGP
jgi:DTW domain-containing protein YfiP